MSLLRELGKFSPFKSRTQADNAPFTTISQMPKRNLSTSPVNPFDAIEHLSTPRKLATVGFFTARTALGVVLIIAILYLVPDDVEVFLIVPYLLFALAAVVFVLFFAKQLREVTKSHFPFIRAIEALILTGMLFLVIFAGIYVMLSGSDEQAFSQPLDHFTALYYSMVVFSTVGFGEIAPTDTTSRAISMIQMILNLVFLGVAIKVLFGAANRSRQIAEALAAKPKPGAKKRVGRGPNGSRTVARSTRRTRPTGSRRSRPLARSR